MSYQRLGRDVYTCVAPPGFDQAPEVIAAIREFDPGAIPLFRVRRWRFPDGHEENVVHHALGRYLPWPRFLRRELPVLLPMDWRGDAPNFLDVVFEDDNTLEYKRGGPGGYIPWDWGVYDWCRFQYDKTTLEAWIRRTEAKAAREKREHEALVAELEYRKKQIEPWLLKQSERITESDWRQYLEAVWGEQRGKVQLRRSKPFVDLGRSHRAETHLRVAPAKERTNVGAP